LRAIVYAAGVARRLGTSSSNRPKVLLEFGGVSLLEQHVAHLCAVDVRTLVVVTGHLRPLIVRAIEDLRERYPIEIREVFNAEFTEGSALSFHASLPELHGQTRPVLLMDGDMLYPTVFLERLISSAHGTVLLVDRQFSTSDDDPVLVPIRSGRPVDFRKCWKGEADDVGESIGFFKVDPADIPLLVEETEKRTSGAGRQDSYDEVLRAMVLAGRFRHEDVTGLPWTEIDFPEDVERARNEMRRAIEKLADRVE